MAGLDNALNRPLISQIGAFAQSRRLLIEAASIVLAIAIFLASVLPNLANHPTITDDEIWVYSAAYKLAEEGVFGSDMFAGFFHADTRYFFNMPAHHFAIAGAFKLLGAGIVQARLVGVAYGIATLLLAYLLARRVYGVPAAILTLVLLLFLRFNMGFDTGLPLQELAANMRYDLAPLPFLLGGVLLLLGPNRGSVALAAQPEALRGSPGAVDLPLWRAALAGVIFGVAVLMQFFGAFILPIAAAFVWLESLPLQRRLKLIGALAAGSMLAALPYAVFILANYADFQGQAGTIDRRADFDQPRFYIDNLLNEPDRFLRPLAFKEVPRGADHYYVDPRFLSLQETLTRRPSAKLGVIIGVPAALAFAAWRGFRGGSRADRLLCLCLGGLVLQYALFESAKFYIYWVPVLPFLCVGIAGVVAWLWQPRRWTALRLVLAGAAAAALLVVLAEGSVARLGGMRAAPDATNYDRLAEEIHRYVPSGSRVVGSTSLWWGLRDMDYRSYFLFFYKTRPDAGADKTTISRFLADFDAEYLVLTRLAIGELDTHLSQRDKDDWHAYMRDHGTLIKRIEGPVVIGAYGFIDIWRFD